MYFLLMKTIEIIILYVIIDKRYKKEKRKRKKGLILYNFL